MLTLKNDALCEGCKSKLLAGERAHGSKLAGNWCWLCPPCWSKCERRGRSPRQVLRAILLFDDEGVCENLDEEDVRDLERLHLWPLPDYRPAATAGDPIAEAEAEALAIGQAVEFFSGGTIGCLNEERPIVGTVKAVRREPVPRGLFTPAREKIIVVIDAGDGGADYELYTYDGWLRYGGNAEIVRRKSLAARTT